MRWKRMYYDLNVPWSTDQIEIQRTLAFLAECELITIDKHNKAKISQ